MGLADLIILALVQVRIQVQHVKNMDVIPSLQRIQQCAQDAAHVYHQIFVHAQQTIKVHTAM